MPTFRSYKKAIREWITHTDWNEQNMFPKELQNASEMELINPLIACLPQGGVITDRAALILGETIARLYTHNKEVAQNCIRRFMWHMNEESGNIGWGVPLAFGQSLARCDGLAKIYHKILISYIYDSEGDNTYCDHAPLRVECYEAVYILGLARSEYRERICQVLKLSKEDDSVCLQKIEKILQAFEHNVA